MPPATSRASLLPPLLLLAASSFTLFIAVQYSSYSQQRDKQEMRVGALRDREDERRRHKQHKEKGE